MSRGDGEQLFFPIGQMNEGAEEIMRKALSDKMRNVARHRIGSARAARQRNLVMEFMSKHPPKEFGRVVITRYANRKLYMKLAHTYITAAEVFLLLERGYNVQVVSKANEDYDMTRDALLHAILIEYKRFPLESIVNFILRNKATS